MAFAVLDPPSGSWSLSPLACQQRPCSGPLPPLRQASLPGPQAPRSPGLHLLCSILLLSPASYCRMPRSQSFVLFAAPPHHREPRPPDAGDSQVHVSSPDLSRMPGSSMRPPPRIATGVPNRHPRYAHPCVSPPKPRSTRSIPLTAHGTSIHQAARPRTLASPLLSLQHRTSHPRQTCCPCLQHTWRVWPRRCYATLHGRDLRLTPRLTPLPLPHQPIPDT